MQEVTVLTLSITVEEEFDESPLRDLHQASQAAHASGAPLDPHVIDGWGEVDKKLQSLADEVHQAAPSGLFDAAPGSANHPSSAAQMEQLQCITQVHCCYHIIMLLIRIQQLQCKSEAHKDEGRTFNRAACTSSCAD